MRDYTINKVDGFNPYEHLKDSMNAFGNPTVNENGEVLQYLPVSVKISWFRRVYPLGKFELEDISNPSNPLDCTYCAKVYADRNDPEGAFLSSWIYSVCLTTTDTPEALTTKKQMAESIALSKALSRAGFGAEIEMFSSMSDDEQSPVITKRPENASKEKENKDPNEKKKSKQKKSKSDEASKTESKTDESKLDISELDDLLDLAFDEDSSQEKQKDFAVEEDSTFEENELENALKTKLVLSEKTNNLLVSLEGSTLEEILEDIPDFCMVLLRENIKKQVNSDIVEAAKVVLQHNSRS